MFIEILVKNEIVVKLKFLAKGFGQRSTMQKYCILKFGHIREPFLYGGISLKIQNFAQKSKF